MTLRFTKMHGLGNDFMVIDAVNQQVRLSQKEISALSRRDTGIGFDQCLIVEPGRSADMDFYYRIFNADGQEVGQCGNGARCLARFVSHYGLTQKKRIRVATPTTEMILQINDDDSVTVDFGLPRLVPAQIPLKMDCQAEYYPLPLADGSIHMVHALSVGNPHAITVVSDLTHAAVASLGREISEHPLFPEQSNAGFMLIRDPAHIELRVYERGCGETRACGSGAVAAAVAGRLFHQLAPQVQVSLPGGKLLISWENESSPIFLTGPACFVYEGSVMA
ncbi:diaminopimelate epimerase [Legionella sp. CNM-4043-24]|uniref:diaminopimelate epimerase n=1 Tax=Legionella sp. CNM-4043-24 TaxID=3421646 RepID=UPI00403AF4C9